MSEQSPGDAARPSAPTTAQEPRRNRHNRRGGNNNNQPRVSGKEESLKGYIYDVGENKGSSELFTSLLEVCRENCH